MLSRETTAKPFVWSGIALSIPPHWEAGYLGAGYAVLESGFRPVLEFKTAVIMGRFSFRRHMHQLARNGRSAGDLSVTPMRLPVDWPRFPETAEVEAFRWQGTTLGGQGLLHYCRTCRRAALIQFYTYPDGGGGAAAAPSVLASLRDHGLDAGPTLAVYDIAATLPARLPLAQFRFTAGRFELVFRRRGERVTLWRLSPASVLLERYGYDLAAVAQDQGLLPPAVSPASGRALDGAMEWRWRSGGLTSRLQALLTPQAPPPDSALRVWQPPHSNRLLAVRADTVRGDNLFETICDAYGII
jgi:hypothetical protein